MCRTVILSGLLALTLSHEPDERPVTQAADWLAHDPQRVAAAQAILHGMMVQAATVRAERV